MNRGQSDFRVTMLYHLFGGVRIELWDIYSAIWMKSSM